jgi:hypothetical protein
MISKNPSDRYQSAEEATEDMEAVFAGIHHVNELPSIQKFKIQAQLTAPVVINGQKKSNGKKKLLLFAILIFATILCLVTLIAVQ